MLQCLDRIKERKIVVKYGDFYATEVLKITQEEIEIILNQLREIYGNATNVNYANNYDDEHYRKTGCSHWYNITSNVVFTIKISEIPLIYKARNGKKITDFDSITIIIHKNKGNTETKQQIISYGFNFRNNGNVKKGIFEINSHYFYDTEINNLKNIISEYHKELYNYLPDEKTQIYTRRHLDKTR